MLATISPPSIFLDINLPNPTTWFYASGLLAIALFFKFNRLVSIRNLDVLTLFLPMPGFLLLLEAQPPQVSGLSSFWGYLWLLGTACYFLVRCFADLALVQRPALGANLEFPGLVWLAAALYAGLIAVAVREPEHTIRHEGRESGNSNTVSSGSGSAAEPSSSGPIDSLPEVVDALGKSAHPSFLRLWVERGLNLACHLSVVLGLTLIGWRHFGSVSTGLSAATFYLLFPYSYLLLPGAPHHLGRWDHPWCMVWLVWAVFCYRSPWLAGLFLGLACGSVFFPLVTVPTWLSFYRGRGEWRFARAFLLSSGTCLLVLLLLLWLNDGLPVSLQSDWTRSDWQPWKRPHKESFWQGIPSPRVSRAPWVYRLPVFVASTALILTTFFWPGVKNLAHVLALSSACLLSVELWYADRGGTHLFWYLPFLLLLVFRPNLSSAQPPSLGPSTEQSSRFRVFSTVAVDAPESNRLGNGWLNR